MPRGPQIFRKSDVTRAIKAARAAGEEHFTVQINKGGNIEVIIGKVEAPPIAAESIPAKWEKWLNED